MNALAIIDDFMARRGPMFYFALLRLGACSPPVVILITRSDSAEDNLFGPGLVAYCAALGLVIWGLYQVALGPYLMGRRSILRTRHSTTIACAVAGVDLLGGLTAVMLSSGWGSLFWFASLTSIVIPCSVVGLRWAFAIAAAYIGMCAGLMTLSDDVVWMAGEGSQRHIFFIAMLMVVLLAGALGYLGDVCSELDQKKRQAEMAFYNLNQSQGRMCICRVLGIGAGVSRECFGP